MGLEQNEGRSEHQEITLVTRGHALPLPPAPGQDLGLVLGRVLFGAWMKVECSVGGEWMLQASLVVL